jgi:Tfp pilus assembly protein PilE
LQPHKSKIACTFEANSVLTAMRTKNDVTLQEAMQAMLRYYKLEGRYTETRLRAAWDRLMGKTIATYTSEFVVRRHTLYLTILSAPLRQELQFGKDRICTLLNEAMGEECVREIVIR